MPYDISLSVSNECGSAEERAKLNTSHELDVQNGDLLREMLEDFDIQWWPKIFEDLAY